jgi:hypothetical protein
MGEAVRDLEEYSVGGKRDGAEEGKQLLAGGTVSLFTPPSLTGESGISKNILILPICLPTLMFRQKP